MNTVRTADDFPTVLDAIYYCNTELNRISEMTDKEEAQREMDKYWCFHNTVLARIEREEGGESPDSILKQA
ncbi:hypothetical protein [Aneurinibacillus sp. REN35]|uniref:hypothetical protein n=1 Tax=Aneurinibacillus sp. REN35 TaxID=3237286 RepID=UPI0035290AAA